MIVRAVCQTKPSTLPGRESWQPRGFLTAKDPDKVLIYLIYLATLSTLPTSLRWQPRSAGGSLDRNGRRFAAHCGAKAQAFGWTARELLGLHLVPERPAANYSRLSRLDRDRADLAVTQQAGRRFDGDHRSYPGRYRRSDLPQAEQAGARCCRQQSGRFGATGVSRAPYSFKQRDVFFGPSRPSSQPASPKSESKWTGMARSS